MYDAFRDTTQEAVRHNLERIINQTFKLLPIREEKGDWQKPLDTLLVELMGMANLFQEDLPLLLSVVCKLEGLRLLTDEEDFILYRRTILEVCNLLKKLEDCL